MARKGRPTGQFQEQADRLLSITKQHPAESSTYYSMRLGVSVTQVQKYLSHLKSTGKIETTTVRVRLGQAWVNRRSIKHKEAP